MQWKCRNQTNLEQKCAGRIEKEKIGQKIDELITGEREGKEDLIWRVS